MATVLCALFVVRIRLPQRIREMQPQLVCTGMQRNVIAEPLRSHRISRRISLTHRLVQFRIGDLRKKMRRTWARDAALKIAISLPAPPLSVNKTVAPSNRDTYFVGARNRGYRLAGCWLTLLRPRSGAN